MVILSISPTTEKTARMTNVQMKLPVASFIKPAMVAANAVRMSCKLRMPIFSEKFFCPKNAPMNAVEPVGAKP